MVPAERWYCRLCFCGKHRPRYRKTMAASGRNGRGGLKWEKEDGAAVLPRRCNAAASLWMMDRRGNSGTVSLPDQHSPSQWVPGVPRWGAQFRWVSVSTEGTASLATCGALAVLQPGCGRSPAGTGGCGERRKKKSIGCTSEILDFTSFSDRLSCGIMAPAGLTGNKEERLPC